MVDEPTKSFTCITCDYEFDSPTGLGQHIAIAHKECGVCGDVLESEEDLDEHTKDQH